MAEGARLESVFRGNPNVGSNPTLSASTFGMKGLAAISSIISSNGELKEQLARVTAKSECSFFPRPGRSGRSKCQINSPTL